MQLPCEENEPAVFHEWKVTGMRVLGWERGGRGEGKAQGGMVGRGQSTHCCLGSGIFLGGWKILGI